MNAQEIFDKSFTHLFEQGKPGWSPYKGCRYRTNDGAACGVGCLIDDETAQLWDRLPASGIVSVKRKGMLPDWMAPHYDLLEAIQDKHDRLANEMDGLYHPEMFRGSLILAYMEIATQFNLDTKVLA